MSPDNFNPPQAALNELLLWFNELLAVRAMGVGQFSCYVSDDTMVTITRGRPSRLAGLPDVLAKFMAAGPLLTVEDEPGKGPRFS